MGNSPVARATELTYGAAMVTARFHGLSRRLLDGQVIAPVGPPLPAGVTTAG